MTRDAGTSLPDFIIVGAMRSGTTSLVRVLKAIPGVYVPPRKELHFFDNNFERGLGWYSRWFTAAPDGSVRGEATPSYMYLASAVARIVGTLPQAKLVVLLRNPIDRAYSHYWLSRARGVESLSFEAAILAEPSRLSNGNPQAMRDFSYVDRGRYAAQLRRLAEAHDGSLLHVMILDDLVDAPGGTLGRLLTFLGVDSTHALPGLPNVNGHFEWRHTWLLPATRSLGRLGPAGRVLRRKLRRRLRVPTRYPAMDRATRLGLAPLLRPEVEALSKWLERDLTHWLRD